MEGWPLIVLGIALAVIIASRMRSDTRMSSPENFSQADIGQLRSSDHNGVFNIKVVAVEFDEVGPVIYVNGEFRNMDERLEIDIVSAEISIGIQEEMFLSFDPGVEDRSSGSRIGGLVSFISPVSLEPYEKGMFRAPLFSPDREERMNEIVERLDLSAIRMVEKFDMEFGEYSLEGKSFERLSHDFVHDRVIQEIRREIENEFIWRAGDANITLNYLTVDDELVESVHTKLYITQSDVETLRNNIDILIVNSLRQELEISLGAYNSVVYER
ncbi:hypothetical protein MNBD_NITROSPINAE04-1836 [hydrothermal vent metagenome]|uniref:Uncharacterized protein n=1 Tax=hydrothermal vent metagenome TaxID=652676 RepID=A0A3B1CQ27_9ZZZZ